jgi:hypothetical protein
MRDVSKKSDDLLSVLVEYFFFLELSSAHLESEKVNSMQPISRPWFPTPSISNVSRQGRNQRKFYRSHFSFATEERETLITQAAAVVNVTLTVMSSDMLKTSRIGFAQRRNASVDRRPTRWQRSRSRTLSWAACSIGASGSS